MPFKFQVLESFVRPTFTKDPKSISSTSHIKFCQCCQVHFHKLKGICFNYWHAKSSAAFVITRSWYPRSRVTIFISWRMWVFWHLSGSLPPWPPTVKIVYGWNICRHWWDTLSYKPMILRHHCYRPDHPHHCLIIVVVVGGPFWFLHSLSLCPFSLALTENALSRVIIRKAHRQPHHLYHHHPHHHCLLHKQFQILQFKSLFLYGSKDWSHLCSCNDFVSEMWSPRGWVSSKTH